MLTQIKGLHHVTSLASNAQANNAFFTEAMGLRRVKKTVNFDAPDVYHLYYGDCLGYTGLSDDLLPVPQCGRVANAVWVRCLALRSRCRAEASTTGPPRLGSSAATQVAKDTYFGAPRLTFSGPDGDDFALIEVQDDRTPWTEGGIDPDLAVRGFHSASMRLADDGATAEVLRFMGYEVGEKDGASQRFVMPDGNGADSIDIETIPGAQAARQGAGSVHHIAFAVEDRAAQLEVRKALLGHRPSSDAGDRPRLFLGHIFSHPGWSVVRGCDQRTRVRRG